MATRPTVKRKTPLAEYQLTLSPDTSFDELVATLKGVLTIPEIPGFKGCRPCLSGLDRLIIEDPVIRNMR